MPGFVLSRSSPGSGGKIPRSVEKPILAGYAENEGALLTTDVNDNFVACGADPAQIAAVAITPGGADTSGFNILGRKEFPQLTMQAFPTSDGAIYLVPFLGALPAVPGGNFGVTRDVDSNWKIDFNKIGGTAVTYIGNPVRSPVDAAGVGQNVLVEVMFQPGVIQPI